MDCEISAELTNFYPPGGRKARSEGRGADRNDHEPGRPGEIVWAGEQVWETLRHRRLFPWAPSKFLRWAEGSNITRRNLAKLAQLCQV